MLQLDTATIAIGKRAILHDVSLSIPAGRVTVLIGPNGAGKSTLMRALSGEIAPTRGRVLLDGRDLTAVTARELASRRAVMPQATQLGFPFRVEEVVGLGASVPAFAMSRTSTAVREAMELADISVLHHRLYTELSGGERQRVHFARAMCQLIAARTPPEHTILLLDEPTSSLDIPHQMLLMERADNEARRGRAVVAVLHDLNLAATWGDQIVAVSDGRVAAVGPPPEVLTGTLLSRIYKYPIVVLPSPDGTSPSVLPQSMRRRGCLATGSCGHTMRRNSTPACAQPDESQPCD